MLFDRVSDVNNFSNAALDDAEDTVRKSRGRDQQMLRDANDAIVSSRDAYKNTTMYRLL